MNKEKLVSLQKYAKELTDRLQSEKLPEKHKNREASYKDFLNRELEKTKKKIDELSMK